MSWIGERLVRRRRVVVESVQRMPAEREQPPSDLAALMQWFRALFQRQARQAPSVDQVNARDTAEQDHRNRLATEQIARSLAKKGSWFPGDDD